MARKDRWSEVRDGVLKTFGEELRGHRLAGGIPLREVGERSQIHLSEVGLLERGQREPRLGTLIKLAVALDIPFERLGEASVERFEYEAGSGWRARNG